MAFGAPLMAYAATIEDEGPVRAVQRFVVMPMFLFAGTFFPLALDAGLPAVDRLDLADVARHRSWPRRRTASAMPLSGVTVAVHLRLPASPLTVVGLLAGRAHLRAEADR